MINITYNVVKGSTRKIHARSASTTQKRTEAMKRAEGDIGQPEGSYLHICRSRERMRSDNAANAHMQYRPDPYPKPRPYGRGHRVGKGSVQ